METQGKILIVDDEPHQRTILSEAAKELGYEVTTADNGKAALGKLRFSQYDLLVTDLQMPGMDGLRLVENAKVHEPTVSIIVVTAHGTIETAVEAMKKGADDYLVKPIELAALEISLKRVFAKRVLVRENSLLISENEALKRHLDIRYHVTGSIGKGPQSKKMLERVQEAIRNSMPLLILGEVGAGKDDLARMIHFNSPWAENSLIFFDCLTVPEELQELHLFGEEAGVEGGVKIASRPGLIEKARMGTLVVSNMHRLSRKCQPRLARALKEDRTQRSGGSKFYSINLRFIGTSEKHEFERAKKDGKLRPDLYSIMAAQTIEIAPLRERREDIPILIAATARRIGTALGKDIQKIDKAVVDRMVQHDFPGNLRELSAMVEAAVIRCQGPELKLEHFGH